MKRVMILIAVLVFILTGCGFSKPDMSDEGKLTFSIYQSSQREDSDEAQENSDDPNLETSMETVSEQTATTSQAGNPDQHSTQTPVPSPERPSITLQPEDQVVSADTTAVFTVQASGTNLSYQWEVSKDGGKSWSNTTFDGGNNNTFQFKTKKEYSGLMYRCVIKNDLDTVISNSVKLTVQSNQASTPTPVSTPAPTPDLSGVVEDTWSGECTYSYNNENGGQSSKTAIYHVPKINLDFTNVQAINEEILANFSRAKDESDAGYPLNGRYPAFLSIDYEWSVKGNILSLLVTCWRDGPDVPGYYLYTLYVDTGREVPKGEIIRAAGITEQDYCTRVKEALGSVFWDQSFGPGTEYDLGTWQRYKSYLEDTISQDNVDMAQPFFNKNGELCVLGLAFYDAGKNPHDTLVNLENYVLSPNYAETIPMPENTTVVSDKYIVNVAKSAYFRSTPSESEDNVICTIPLNTKVGFIEVTDNVFSRVKYNGQYGYVKSEFLSNYPEVQTPVSDGGNTTVVSYKYIVNVDKAAYFRSTPSENADNVINTLLLNTKVGFIEVTDSVFSKVEYKGQYGYVKTEFLGNSPESTTSVSGNTTVESYKYIVNVAKTAYFRSTPNEYEDNVICTIPLNTKVGFIEVTDSVFSRVEYNGQYGYVKSEFLGDYPESVSAPIDRGKGMMKEATAMAI